MTDRTRRTSSTLLAAACLLAACDLDDGDDGRQEMTIVVEADTQKLQQQEADLAQRRAELEGQRDQLLQERQTLLQRSSQRSDLAGLIESQKKLLDRERQLRAREAEIERERSGVSAKKSELLSGIAGGGAGRVAASPQRGLDIARREDGIANREADLARREKTLAEREAALARREARVTPPPIVTTVVREPGRRVSRKLVEKNHKEARALIRKRGLLQGDLPPETREIERNIYSHSRKGRWAEAGDAVDDLRRIVESVQVDESFVQVKMGRLNRLRSKKKLGKEDTNRVDELLSQATVAFADGRHAAANGRLNKIFAILRKK